MLILVDHVVPPDVLSLVNGEGVCHHPVLAGPSRIAALMRHRPDALITWTPLDAAERESWQATAEGDPRVVALLGGGPAPHDDGAEPAVHHLPAGGVPPLELYTRALALAERNWFSAVAGAGVAAGLAAAGRGRSSVALIGAGVVNLVTALRLVRDGHEVTVYDACPAPGGDASWEAHGCSWGGGDGRMFTLTEADGYHGNTVLGPVPFTRPLDEQGWCVAPPGAMDRQELSWVLDNHRIPEWLAASFTSDVLSFNHLAKGLWDELISEESDLFQEVGFREGILRLYTDPGRLRSQIIRQRGLGASLGELTSSQVAASYPALSAAHANGVLAGGIEVVGFTVQIHSFLARLVGILEKQGVLFHWESTVEGTACGKGGLHSAGEALQGDHYVLSPGAYGGELLRGTATHNRIHGVLGSWLTLPNVHPRLRNSIKISRSGHLAEDANVTVTTDPYGDSHLVVGSGYGWTGADPRNVDPGRLDSLHAAVADTAATFFPEAYEQARDTGLLQTSIRHCVRPWTASSLPVLEVARNGNGGLAVVTGGHNTGGFAQAPAVAEAVAAALRGAEHPMQVLYHPDRLQMFYRQR
ncbi:NAD(P)/FAD-dependent oxidoreductase [Actinomadura macrotermitis]|uniref:D-amino acid dehydrogenase n=1 Tax=Actinomadura macrotermitis TaxID=2585200 RepID=A0A7K0C027_9ACTN|nr:FAD-binding oxidoreductase [Actinomadura macrotermitis]MQY06800.1 D-amino acid dehydrogenase [Actinomadura macrotermitis]